MRAPLDLTPAYEMCERPRTCSYLPSERARLHYRLYPYLDAARFAELLRRGWRRFGRVVFRPACQHCSQCRSLRVRVPEFQPSKSQRRALKRNSDVRLVVRPPQVSAEHVRLFNDYHADMQNRRGWPANPIDEDRYEDEFLGGRPAFGREFAYYRDDRLIGIGLVDVVAEAASSVYFYHDPAWRPLGPGTFSMLQELRFAAAAGLQHHYLGYWVSACPSMQYKATYRPHDLLTRYPDDDEEPDWEPVE